MDRSLQLLRGEQEESLAKHALPGMGQCHWKCKSRCEKKKVFSIIANTAQTVDRGTGFGPNSNHHQCVAGCEVMLADGNLVRTGQSGISNSPSAFLSKFTYGPSIEGLFWQSNLGIVTKMSIWLTPQPSTFMSCVFNMPEFDDLEIMVDALGLMRRNGVIPSVIWIGNIVEALCIRGRRRDYWKEEGPIPDWRVKQLQEELKLGCWTARFGLYGPRRIVQAHFDEISQILKDKAPTGELMGKLFTGDNGGLLDAASVPFEDGNVLVGVPSLLSIPLMNWPLKDDGVEKAAHGDYAPIIPSSGKRLLDWMRRAKVLFEASGLELMTDFFMHERHVIVTGMYSFNQYSPVEREAVHRLFHALHEEAKDKGYGMYRGHIQHMGEFTFSGLNSTERAYSSDNRLDCRPERLQQPCLYQVCRDLEGTYHLQNTRKLALTPIWDAIDPNGILAPGKQGIWPRKYRHLRGKTGTTTPQNKL